MPTAVDYSPLTHPVDAPTRTNATAHAVSRLAEVNGWQYFTHAAAQPLPGVVFREPNGRPRLSQRAVNIVRIPGDPAIEIGDSFYAAIAQGNQYTQTWGYAAVDLGVDMPSLTVEARINRRLSPLPATPTGAVQNDRHPGMIVEAAPGSEQDADSLLTPEILTALDDEEYPLDLEVAGRWLFLYAPRSLSTDDAASWRHVFHTVDLVTTRVHELHPTGAATSAGTSTVAHRREARGARVNGRRVTWQLGLLVVAMVGGAVAALIFGGR